MNDMNEVTQLLEQLAQFLMDRMDGVRTDDHVVLDIETLDNPGWMVASIFVPGLTETTDGRKSVGAFDEESQDWWTCYEEVQARMHTKITTNSAVVTAYGGPSYLPVIAEKVYSRVVYGVLDETAAILSDELIKKLSTWLVIQCDGHWEHSEGVGLVLTSTGQWKFEATNVSTHLWRKDLERAERPDFPLLGRKKVWQRDTVMIDQCWYHDSTDIGGLADMLETFLNNSELDPSGLPSNVPTH